MSSRQSAFANCLVAGGHSGLGFFPAVVGHLALAGDDQRVRWEGNPSVYFDPRPAVVARCFPARVAFVETGSYRLLVEQEAYVHVGMQPLVEIAREDEYCPVAKILDFGWLGHGAPFERLGLRGKVLVTVYDSIKNEKSQ